MDIFGPIPGLKELSGQTPYDLFVYGERLSRCAMNADCQESAHTWGRLSSPRGILQVPKTRCVFAKATGNPVEDADTLQSSRLRPAPFERPTGHWDKITGMLLRFHDPGWRIPPIDRMMRRGSPKGSVYIGMIPITKGNGQTVWAWCHVLNYESKSGWVRADNSGPTYPD